MICGFSPITLSMRDDRKTICGDGITKRNLLNAKGAGQGPVQDLRYFYVTFSFCQERV